MQFDPRSQFEPLCRNCVLLYLTCTIRVRYKVSEIYFVTNWLSLFSHKSSNRCTLKPTSIHIYLISTPSNPHLLCPHSMSIDPSWWRGCGGEIYSSPCTEWCLSPMHEGMYGLVGFHPDEEGDGYVRWFLGTYVWWTWRKVSIRQYITTLDPSSSHLSARKFFLLPLQQYPHPT